MDQAAKLTDKIMSEFMEDLNGRFDYISEYKKKACLGVSYTESSEKYQEYIKRFLIKNAIKEYGLLEKDAGKKFDETMTETIAVAHASKTSPEKTAGIYAMRKGIKEERDPAAKDSKLQDLLREYRNIFNRIPAKEKDTLVNDFFRGQLRQKQTLTKVNAEVNRQLKTNGGYNTDKLSEGNVGYCLKAITVGLYEANKKYGCMDFLPKDVEKALRPVHFLPEIQKDEGHGKHVFSTEGGKNLAQLIDENDIRPGAIVLLADGKGNPKHAMVYSGRNEGGEPLLMGFNSEDKGVVASSSKGGDMRRGFIIDTRSLVHQGVERLQRKSKDLLRGSQTEQPRQDNKTPVFLKVGKSAER